MGETAGERRARRAWLTRNPVKLWREGRGLTRREAADVLEMGEWKLKQIEEGQLRQLSPSSLRFFQQRGLDTDELRKKYMDWMHTKPGRGEEIDVPEASNLWDEDEDEDEEGDDGS